MNMKNGKVKGLKSVVKIVWSNLKGLVPTFKEKGTLSNVCICKVHIMNKMVKHLIQMMHNI